MSTKSWHLSRRTVLRGLGATVALPFLECMTPLTRAAAAASKPPVRLMFHWIGTATNMEEWFPKDDGPNYTISPALQPLARVREHFSVISGTRNFSQLDYGNQGYVGGHNSGLVWLAGTGKRTGPGPTDIKPGWSADQVAAKHIGQDTKFPSLQLGIYKSGFHILSWSENGTPLPTMSSPLEIYQSLFAPKNPKEIEAFKANLAQKQSLLDLVTASRHDLERRLGRADKEKIDQYLTSIRELETGFERDAKWIDVPPAKIDVKAPAPETAKEKSAWFSTMFDLIRLAFQTDTTRVVAFAGYGPNGDDFSFIPGVTELWHPISHHNQDKNKLAQMTKINAYISEQLASFYEKMHASKEADGSSLLDNSLLLSGDSMTDGQHWGGNYPLILAGHAGGRLKQGQHLRFCETPNYSQAAWPLARVPTANLYLSMLKYAGVPIESFADSTEPLQGLV